MHESPAANIETQERGKQVFGVLPCIWMGLFTRLWGTVEIGWLDTTWDPPRIRRTLLNFHLRNGIQHEEKAVFDIGFEEAN